MRGVSCFQNSLDRPCKQYESNIQMAAVNEKLFVDVRTRLRGRNCVAAH